MQHNSDLSISPEIVEFLDSCLWDKGMRDLPNDLRVEMIQNLAARLQPWLLHAAAEKLSDKDANDLDAFLDETQDPIKVQGFLRERIPNLDQIFGDAMIQFKQTYVQG